MRKKILSFSILLISILGFSQNSFAEMKEPYVKVIDNNNVIEEYTLITNKKTGENIQVGMFSKADVNLIHRDYFITFSTFYYFIFSSGIIEEMVGDDNVTIETLKKPIGEPDVKIIMNFTEEGLQMSAINGVERVNETVTWDQMMK